MNAQRREGKRFATGIVRHDDGRVVVVGRVLSAQDKIKKRWEGLFFFFLFFKLLKSIVSDRIGSFVTVQRGELLDDGPLAGWMYS